MNLFIDAAATHHWQWDKPREDREQPHLIRLAAALEDHEHGVRDRISLIIRPLYGWGPIDPDVQHHHQIDEATATNSGRVLGAVIGRFANMIAHADNIIAHSANYHVRLLQRAYADIGIPPPALTNNTDAIICTMRRSTNICRVPNPTRKGLKWPTMLEAAIFFADKEDSTLPKQPSDPEELGHYNVDLVRLIWHGIEAHEAAQEAKRAEQRDAAA